MAEYLIQGKHFAVTQGAQHFADDEVLDSEGMYAAALRKQTVGSLQVRAQPRGIALDPTQ